MDVMRRPGPNASVADWKGYAQAMQDEAIRQAKIGNGAIYEADALRTELAGAVDRVAELEAELVKVRESRDAWRLQAMREHDAEQLAGAVRTLADARLYGEKMIRDRDEAVRGCGADLLGIIGGD